MLELVGGGKKLINYLPNPSHPLPIVAPDESRSRLVKINQTCIANELLELSRVNAICILPTVYLLMGPHNALKVSSDKGG